MCHALSLNFVITLDGLGHAHASTDVNTENDRDISARLSAAGFLILDLGGGLNDVVYSGGLRALFFLKVHDVLG